MNNIWLTSDLHFNHSRIIHYCNRPFDGVQKMNHELIKRWNSVVDENDTVYVLGDVFFGSNWKDLASKLKQMKGNLHLILGNHDRLDAWDYIEAGFQSLHTSLKLEDYILIHDPSAACGPKSLKWIHGHIHDIALNIAENCYNVSVEMHDYTPISFNYIKSHF